MFAHEVSHPPAKVNKSGSENPLLRAAYSKAATVCVCACHTGRLGQAGDAFKLQCHTVRQDNRCFRRHDLLQRTVQQPRPRAQHDKRCASVAFAGLRSVSVALPVDVKIATHREKPVV